mmetsp:Transcript_33426/g.44311  ORF Transcript_33426/g.44311 Transcript_33426/m.44311 type:complete len:92 (+) Transcript_33426:29-304(+)
MSTLRRRRVSSRAKDKGSLIYMSALERDDLLSLRKVKESMREKEEYAIPNAKGKYIYVGYKGEFDPTKSFLDMKRLDNNAGREVSKLKNGL